MRFVPIVAGETGAPETWINPLMAQRITISRQNRKTFLVLFEFGDGNSAYAAQTFRSANDAKEWLVGYFGVELA